MKKIGSQIRCVKIWMWFFLKDLVHRIRVKNMRNIFIICQDVDITKMCFQMWVHGGCHTQSVDRLRALTLAEYCVTWGVEAVLDGSVMREHAPCRWQKNVCRFPANITLKDILKHTWAERECSNSLKSMQTLKTFIILFIRLTLICQNMGYVPSPLPSQRATRSSIRPSSWESRVQRTSPQEVCFVSGRETPPVWFIIGRCDSHYSTWSDCACVRYVWHVWNMYLCIYVSMYRCICVSMSLYIYVSMYLCIYVSM